MWDLMAVFAAGLAAGAANAVAGGGSAISFPVLVFVGIPPVAANATNSVGLWPGSVAAAWSYRKRILRIRPRTLWLAAPALAGGLLGAWLLIELPPSYFAALAPFLVMAAALSVAVEPLVRRSIGAASLPHSLGAFPVGLAAMFALAMYGGYFGAGMGLILLATLGLLGLDDLQHANGIKNFMAVMIKLPAVVYFIAIGAARWESSLLMAAGAISGGWVAGHMIQKVNADRLRWVVALIGLGLGVLMLFG